MIEKRYVDDEHLSGWEYRWVDGEAVSRSFSSYSEAEREFEAHKTERAFKRCREWHSA